jgi:hypothetical protein
VDEQEEDGDASLKIWQKKSHEADADSADPRICARCKAFDKATVRWHGL